GGDEPAQHDHASQNIAHRRPLERTPPPLRCTFAEWPLNGPFGWLLASQMAWRPHVCARLRPCCQQQRGACSSLNCRSFEQSKIEDGREKAWASMMGPAALFW